MDFGDDFSDIELNEYPEGAGIQASHSSEEFKNSEDQQRAKDDKSINFDLNNENSLEIEPLKIKEHQDLNLDISQEDFLQKFDKIDPINSGPQKNDQINQNLLFDSLEDKSLPKPLKIESFEKQKEQTEESPVPKYQPQKVNEKADFMENFIDSGDSEGFSEGEIGEIADLEDDDFFADLKDQRQGEIVRGQSTREVQIKSDLTQQLHKIEKERAQKMRQSQKLIVTKEDLRRKDVPLFDCIFCVQRSSTVIKGLLQKSLKTNYFALFRYIANAEQIPITLSNRTKKTKEVIIDEYDADRVYQYLIDAPFQATQDLTQNTSQEEISKVKNDRINNKFQKSSLFLIQMNQQASNREQIYFTRFKKVPKNFQRKVQIPQLASNDRLIQQKSRQIFLWNAFGSNQEKISFIGSSEQDRDQVQSTNLAKKNQIQGSSDFIAEATKEEEIFSGQIGITNWAMTRRQRILRDTSFESEDFDIYKPQYSSSTSVESHKISQLSKENQTITESFQSSFLDSYSSNEDLESERHIDIFKSQGSKNQHDFQDLIMEPLNVDQKQIEAEDSKNSSTTEMDRCDVDLADSENVEDEEVNSIAKNPLFTVQAKNFGKYKSQVNNLKAPSKRSQPKVRKDSKSGEFSSFDANDPNVRIVDESYDEMQLLQELNQEQTLEQVVTSFSGNINGKKCVDEFEKASIKSVNDDLSSELSVADETICIKSSSHNCDSSKQESKDQFQLMPMQDNSEHSNLCHLQDQEQNSAATLKTNQVSQKIQHSKIIATNSPLNQLRKLLEPLQSNLGNKNEYHDPIQVIGQDIVGTHDTFIKDLSFTQDAKQRASSRSFRKKTNTSATNTSGKVNRSMFDVNQTQTVSGGRGRRTQVTAAAEMKHLMTRTPELQTKTNLLALNSSSTSNRQTQKPRNYLTGNAEMALKRLRRSFGPKGSILDGSQDKLKQLGLIMVQKQETIERESEVKNDQKFPTTKSGGLTRHNLSLIVDKKSDIQTIQPFQTRVKGNLQSSLHYQNDNSSKVTKTDDQVQKRKSFLFDISQKNPARKQLKSCNNSLQNQNSTQHEFFNFVSRDTKETQNMMQDNPRKILNTEKQFKSYYSLSNKTGMSGNHENQNNKMLSKQNHKALKDLIEPQQATLSALYFDKKKNNKKSKGQILTQTQIGERKNSNFTQSNTCKATAKNVQNTFLLSNLQGNERNAFGSLGKLNLRSQSSRNENLQKTQIKSSKKELHMIQFQKNSLFNEQYANNQENNSKSRKTTMTIGGVKVNDVRNLNPNSMMTQLRKKVKSSTAKATGRNHQNSLKAQTSLQNFFLDKEDEKFMFQRDDSIEKRKKSGGFAKVVQDSNFSSHIQSSGQRRKLVPSHSLGSGLKLSDTKKVNDNKKSSTPSNSTLQNRQKFDRNQLENQLFREHKIKHLSSQISPTKPNLVQEKIQRRQQVSAFQTIDEAQIEKRQILRKSVDNRKDELRGFYSSKSNIFKRKRSPQPQTLSRLKVLNTHSSNFNSNQVPQKVNQRNFVASKEKDKILDSSNSAKIDQKDSKMQPNSLLQLSQLRRNFATNVEEEQKISNISINTRTANVRSPLHSRNDNKAVVNHQSAQKVQRNFLFDNSQQSPTNLQKRGTYQQKSLKYPKKVDSNSLPRKDYLNISLNYRCQIQKRINSGSHRQTTSQSALSKHNQLGSQMFKGSNLVKLESKLKKKGSKQPDTLQK